MLQTSPGHSDTRFGSGRVIRFSDFSGYVKCNPIKNRLNYGSDRFGLYRIRFGFLFFFGIRMRTELTPVRILTRKNRFGSDFNPKNPKIQHKKKHSRIKLSKYQTETIS